MEELDDRAAVVTQPLDRAISQACEAITHNLSGQRLGPKGRFTRERIIRAAIDLLDNESDEPFTLSAVARKAELRMSSIYNYFNDLSELMIAVLEPVMASADASYVEEIRPYWPDVELAARCEAFWLAFRDFWQRHAALLHQRNRMSDAGDERMLRHRVEAVRPLIACVQRQLGLDDGAPPTAEIQAMSGVLITGIERTMTVQTLPNYRAMSGLLVSPQSDIMRPAAKLLELAIRDSRQTLRAATA